jgi:iron complex transport system substrate-binding protein
MRFKVLALLALGLLALGVRPSAAETTPPPVSITDVAGRTVEVRLPARRVLLGEARLIYGLAPLFGRDLFQHVAGWPNDFRINDAETFEAYRKVYPGIDEVPELGNLTQGSFSVERALALRPDLVLMPLGFLGRAKQDNILGQFETAGVPVLFVDFRERPLDNAVPSLQLMGRVTGRGERAQEVVDFFNQEMGRVYDRVDGFKGARPKVFLERAAGLLDCCATWGNDSFGLLVERAGGDNLGSRLLPGASGTLSPEQVLASRPEVVIVTGANWSRSNPANTAVPLGANADAVQIQARLKGLMARPAYTDSPAARAGRVHAIWHQFYIAPYNFVVFQLLAKWLHPELFADLDPADTFRRFHERFLQVPYAEGYWATLEPGA